MSGNTGYGITVQGFVMPQLSDLTAELQQSVLTQFGANANVVPSSFFGQFIGIVANSLALVWQSMQDVYLSQSPVTAFGASLDNVGALVGIPRLQATYSFVPNFRLFGTAGTFIPTFTQFSVVGSPSSVFQTLSGVTLGAGQNCSQHIAFSGVAASGNWSLSLYGANSAPLPFNATATQVQLALRGLPFSSGCIAIGSMLSGWQITFQGAGTGGLMEQPVYTVATNTLETSGPAPITITPSITTPGVDQASITVTATNTGPIIANVDTLTNIVTPISGLTAALNTQNATIGTNLETDNAYRTRISEEQAAEGAATIEAIRARLLQVPGVTGVIIYENISDTTILDAEYVGDDLPPHSYEAFISGTATDSDIAEMLWLTKPAGIRTYGTQSFVITDSQGIEHTMQWSEPVVVDIYVDITLTVNANYPAGGDAAVQAAIVSYINSLGQGVDVVVDPYLIAQLASVPGITDAVVEVSTDDIVFSDSNITISPVEIAFTQTSFVTVTS